MLVFLNKRYPLKFSLKLWAIIFLPGLLNLIVMGIAFWFYPEFAKEAILGFLALWLLLSIFPVLAVVTPMKELLFKAVNLRKEFKKGRGQTHGTRDWEEYGEWEFLEWAIEKAQRSLKRQNSSLLNEQHKLETVINSLEESIVAFNAEGTIWFCNQSFRTHFLYNTADKLMREIKIGSLIREQKVLDSFQECLKGRHKLELCDLSLPGKNGEKLCFQVTLMPLKLEAEGQNGVIMVFYDMTEQRQLEKMRADFVANISHEVRTPLTAIKGSIEILKQENRPEYLEKIYKNADRLQKLFEDLLQLSQIELSFHPVIETISIADVVDNVLLSLKERYPAKMMEVELDLKLKELPFDSHHFEQIMGNLLENAYKYSGNSKRIVVTSELDQRSQKIIIKVKDFGIGIPQRSLDRIFERFYRVDESRGLIEGTGLGLSIVKHLALNYGGSVEVESEPQVGTTFRLSFPAKN